LLSKLAAAAPEKEGKGPLLLPLLLKPLMPTEPLLPPLPPPLLPLSQERGSGSASPESSIGRRGG
jgi:hypothetical protein